MKKNKNTKDFVRYIFKQMKNYYKLEIVSILLTIGYSVSVVATPYFINYLIDVFIGGVKSSDVWFVTLASLITCFLQPILFFLNTKIIKIISGKIILKIRCLLFDKIINAPFSFFCNNSSGSIISRLVNDSNQVGMFLSTSINTLFKSVLFIILILTGMFFLSKLITVLLCVLLLTFVIFNLFFNKSIEERSRKLYKKNDDFYKIVKQCLDNAEEIKITQQELSISSLFSNFSKDFYFKELKLYNLYNVLNSVNATIGILAISLIYATGFFLISKNKFTIGSIVTFIVYFHMLMPSLKQLLQLNSSYHEVIPAFLRLGEYFKIDPEKDLTVCRSLSNGLSISFDKVTFKYDDNSKNQIILNQISFKLDAPGLYGIIGKSGSGKSTIAKLIAGLYHPLDGNIVIKLDKKFALSMRRDCLAYASQNMRLFYNKTIMYNITLGNPKISDKEVYSICKKLNLHNKISKLPNNYNELVTEKVNFSGGEIQRIILSRIYLQKKPIVILDEITSALDFANTEIVKSIIEDLSKNSLVILLTHNLDLLVNAKQIIKL